MTTPALTSGWPRNATPVTILRQQVTGQDALGNDQYTTVESIQVNAVIVPLEMKLAPRATRGASFAEELQGEFIVSAGLTVYLPPGTVIGVTDLVVVNGETWQVGGLPANFQSPFTGAAALCQVELVRVTG